MVVALMAVALMAVMTIEIGLAIVVVSGNNKKGGGTVIVFGSNRGKRDSGMSSCSSSGSRMG